MPAVPLELRPSLPAVGPAVVAPARRSLRATAGFRRLLSVRLAAQWGDGLFQAALGSAVLFNPEREADPIAVAAGLAVILLPYSVIGPFAGALLDRWDRRRVLLVANLSRALLVGAVAGGLAAGIGGVPLYLGALAVAGVSRFVLCGLSAALPHVVDRRRLVTANVVATTAGAGMAAFGGACAIGLRSVFGAADAGSAQVTALAVVGSVLAWALTIGFRRGLLGPDSPADAPADRPAPKPADSPVDAAAGTPATSTSPVLEVAPDIPQAAAPAAAARAPLSATPAGAPLSATHTVLAATAGAAPPAQEHTLGAVARGLAVGARATAATPTVAASFLAVAAHRLSFGVTTLLTLMLFRYVFTDAGLLRGGLPGIGEAVVLAAAGLAVAATATPWLTRRWGRAAIVRAALIIAALTQVGLSLLLSAPAVLVAAVLLAGAGQVIKLCADAGVQSDIDDDVRGRVFALYDAAFNICYVAAAAAAAVLSPPDGWAPWLIGATAGVYLLGLLAHEAVLRRAPRPSRNQPARF